MLRDRICGVVAPSVGTGLPRRFAPRNDGFGHSRKNRTLVRNNETTPKILVIARAKGPWQSILPFRKDVAQTKADGLPRRYAPRNDEDSAPIPSGQTTVAGFDLTMLGAAVLLALTARRVLVGKQHPANKKAAADEAEAETFEKVGDTGDIENAGRAVA